MAYGKLKVDALIRDNSGSDVEINVADFVTTASPAFTGTPSAPTAAVNTNTTQLATTAYVQAEGFAKTGVVQTYTAAQRGEITTLNPGATVTPNLDDSNNFTLTLDQNLTIANPTNCTAGQTGSIFLVQDGTGSRLGAWGSYWDFAGGVAPVLTTAANAVDRVDYVVRSASSIHAVATLNLS